MRPETVKAIFYASIMVIVTTLIAITLAGPMTP
jgi:hypothetical protein